MSRPTADRLIESANAVEKIAQIGAVLPSRESHVRELLKLESDEQHLHPSQRAMIAAKLATLKPGRPIKEETPQNCGDTKCDEAAKLLNVSPRSVESAKHILANGSKQLVEAGHGNWLTWLSENWRYSRQLAARYMEMANVNSSLHLDSASSISEALRMIADAKQEENVNNWLNRFFHS